MPITPQDRLGVMTLQLQRFLMSKVQEIGMTSLLNLTAIRFQEGFREEWKQERTQLVIQQWQIKLTTHKLTPIIPD